MRLNTLHNLYHYARLMDEARGAIEAGRYGAFLETFRGRQLAAATDEKAPAEDAPPVAGPGPE